MAQTTNNLPLTRRQRDQRAPKPSQARYWMIGLALAAVAAGAVVGTVIFDRGPDRLAGSCGIAIDGSGSADPKSGFDAELDARRGVDPFLVDAGCRRVVFAPIDGSSRSSVCTGSVIDLDPDVTGTVDRPTLRESRRAQALDQVLNMLSCIRHDKRSVPGSDILGALAVLADNRPDRVGTYKLLVISDFEQNDRGVSVYNKDLTKPANRTRIIRQIVSQHRLPDLAGADVATIGFGALYAGKDPRNAEGFRTLWHDIMVGNAKVAQFHPYTRANPVPSGTPSANR